MPRKNLHGLGKESSCHKGANSSSEKKELSGLFISQVGQFLYIRFRFWKMRGMLSEHFLSTYDVNATGRSGNAASLEVENSFVGSGRRYIRNS